MQGLNSSNGIVLSPSVVDAESRERPLLYRKHGPCLVSLARELVEQHELLDIAAGLDASSEIRLKLPRSRSRSESSIGSLECCARCCHP